MREAISNILNKYSHFRQNMPFKGSHEINHLFSTLRSEIASLDFIKSNPNLVVKSSYGKGNWAAVPWLAILDTRETSTTQKGTYVVILFSEDGKHFQLKLAQGVTEVKASFKRNAPEELQRRANKVREEILTERLENLIPQPSNFRLGTGSMAKLYESSTILSAEYSSLELPDDDQLTTLLEKLVYAYEQHVANQISKETQDDQTSDDTQRVWALSAGPNGNQWDYFLKNGLIAIGWDQLGNLELYDSQEAILDALTLDDGSLPTNDALCCYQFSREISINDIVVAKVGRKKVLGMGRVISDYYWDGSLSSYQSRRKVEWLRSDPTEFPGTGTTVKTLTEITPYPSFMSLVNNYLGIEDKDTDTDEDLVEDNFDEYNISSINDDGCFLSEESIRSILNRLRVKKNIILQGPPGTGKTWLAKRLAYALIGRKNPERVKVMQFHTNTTYEDFVRGYRPTSEGKLALIDGAFMEAIEDARNTSQPYVFVIEEVNRGNPAQIFGEMLTLMEADKRSSADGIELTYKRREGEKVHIPPNLYLVGTMNIADRSLALVDLALRRRFAFIDLEPSFNQPWRDWLKSRCDFNSEFIAHIEAKLTALNDTIGDDHRLGNQFRVGHSYVTPPTDADITDPIQWFSEVIQTEITPLILEYWFDDLDKAKQVIKELKQGL